MHGYGHNADLPNMAEDRIVRVAGPQRDIARAIFGGDGGALDEIRLAERASFFGVVDQVDDRAPERLEAVLVPGSGFCRLPLREQIQQDLPFVNEMGRSSVCDRKRTRIGGCKEIIAVVVDRIVGGSHLLIAIRKEGGQLCFE